MSSLRHLAQMQAVMVAWQRKFGPRRSYPITVHLLDFWQQPR
jgi:hypothetical protein